MIFPFSPEAEEINRPWQLFIVLKQRRISYFCNETREHVMSEMPFIVGKYACLFKIYFYKRIREKAAAQSPP